MRMIKALFVLAPDDDQALNYLVKRTGKNRSMLMREAIRLLIVAYNPDNRVYRAPSEYITQVKAEQTAKTE